MNAASACAGPSFERNGTCTDSTAATAAAHRTAATKTRTVAPSTRALRPPGARGSADATRPPGPQRPASRGRRAGRDRSGEDPGAGDEALDGVDVFAERAIDGRERNVAADLRHDVDERAAGLHGRAQIDALARAHELEAEHAADVLDDLRGLVR